MKSHFFIGICQQKRLFVDTFFGICQQNGFSLTRFSEQGSENTNNSGWSGKIRSAPGHAQAFIAKEYVAYGHMAFPRSEHAVRHIPAAPYLQPIAGAAGRTQVTIKFHPLPKPVGEDERQSLIVPSGVGLKNDAMVCG